MEKKPTSNAPPGVNEVKTDRSFSGTNGAGDKIQKNATDKLRDVVLQVPRQTDKTVAPISGTDAAKPLKQPVSEPEKSISGAAKTEQAQKNQQPSDSTKTEPLHSDPAKKQDSSDKKDGKPDQQYIEVPPVKDYSVAAPKPAEAVVKQSPNSPQLARDMNSAGAPRSLAVGKESDSAKPVSPPIDAIQNNPGKQNSTTVSEQHVRPTESPDSSGPNNAKNAISDKSISSAPRIGQTEIANQTKGSEKEHSTVSHTGKSESDSPATALDQVSKSHQGEFKSQSADHSSGSKLLDTDKSQDNSKFLDAGKSQSEIASKHQSAENKSEHSDAKVQASEQIRGSKLDSILGMQGKIPFLDELGNGIKFGDRKDVIDKINGPIANQIAAASDGVKLVVIAAAKAIDSAIKGVQGGDRGSDGKSEAAGKGKQNEPTERIALLENMLSGVRKLPVEQKSQNAELVSRVMKNPNEKFEGKDKEFTDSLKGLKKSELSIVRDIFLIGKKPEFSALSDKFQDRLVSIFQGLIDSARGNRGDAGAPLPGRDGRLSASDGKDKSNEGKGRSADGKDLTIDSKDKSGEGKNKSKEQKSDSTQVSSADKITSRTGRRFDLPEIASLVTRTLFPEKSTDKQNTKTTEGAVAKTADKQVSPHQLVEQIIARLREQGVLKPITERLTQILDKNEGLKQSERGRVSERLADNVRVMTNEKRTETARIEKEAGETPARPGMKSNRVVAENNSGSAVQGKTHTQVIDKNDSKAASGERESAASSRGKDARDGYTQPVSYETGDSQKPAEELGGDDADVAAERLSRMLRNKDTKLSKTTDYREDEDKKEQKKSSKTRRRYVVQRGDTLKSIAGALMQDEALAVVLYHHNQAKVSLVEYLGKKYATLEVGSVLMIPNDQRVQEFKKLTAAATFYAKIEFGPVPYESVKDELAELDSTVTDMDIAVLDSTITAPPCKYISLSPVARIAEVESATNSQCAVLEYFWRDQWVKIREYELTDDETLLHIYGQNGKRKKTTSLNIPNAKVKDLLQFKMWRQNVEDFLNS